MQVRKIRERKSKILKADDLLVDNASGGNTEDWLRELGSRRTPQVNLKPDPDNFDIDSFNTNGEVPPEAVRVKEEPGDDPMDIDDVPAKTRCSTVHCAISWQTGCNGRLADGRQWSPLLTFHWYYAVQIRPSFLRHPV
ncbi:hypothetical protein J6590_083232 [Homalodisca vitripennis]|nr:hypothetical protein J6590_083232 [Homalodisca vitripennis]